MVGGGKDLVVAGMEEETGDLGGRGWPGIDRIDIRGRIGGGGGEYTHHSRGVPPPKGRTDPIKEELDQSDHRACQGEG
jgi:hypothetical protein